MANGNRMGELVQRIEADAAFKAELEQAPSVDTKRAVLDQHGFGDVTLADAQAYLRQTMPELSEEALEQIAGGLTQAQGDGILAGTAGIGFLAGAAGAAAG